MRVLLIANTLPPADLSGVGEQVLQLAAGLRELGHEVRILGRGPGGARGSKLLFPLTAVAASSRAVHDFAPDVVQVHESDGGLAAAWLRLRRSSRGRGRGKSPLLVALLQVSYVEERRAVRPLVHDGRVLGVPGATERRFRRLKVLLQIALGRLSARVADRVLVPSEATGEEIRRDYGIGETRVVPNATGGLEVAPDPVPGLESGAGDLLFVGRLRIRKGVEVLLEALAALAREQRRVRLLIAGDGEQLEALRARAGELGLGNDRIRFLGRVRAGQVRWLLARTGALVVPSIYEGMPLVVLEAMAAGVPVVASRVSGIPEVVLDGATGWLVPCEDPPALARALRAVLDDPQEARRGGEAGRRRVDERYRPRHAARAWEDAVGGEGRE
jgi:glycosyltransferase involved in cell wall biosynthesis